MHYSKSPDPRIQCNIARYAPLRDCTTQRVSDPSSGVAHPVFIPAGRLDPVVTLTRGIDMYLIRPFPRPQFF